MSAADDPWALYPSDYDGAWQTRRNAINAGLRACGYPGITGRMPVPLIASLRARVSQRGAESLSAFDQRNRDKPWR